MNTLNFGNQKVKVQDRGGITYAGTVTAQAEAYSTPTTLCVRLLIFQCFEAVGWVTGRASGLKMFVGRLK